MSDKYNFTNKYDSAVKGLGATADTEYIEKFSQTPEKCKVVYKTYGIGGSLDESTQIGPNSNDQEAEKTYRKIASEQLGYTNQQIEEKLSVYRQAYVNDDRASSLADTIVFGGSDTSSVVFDACGFTARDFSNKVDDYKETEKAEIIQSLADDEIIRAQVSADREAADCLLDINDNIGKMSKTIDFFWENIAPKFGVPAGSRGKVPFKSVDPGTSGDFAEALHNLDTKYVTDYMGGNPGDNRNHLDRRDKNTGFVGYNVNTDLVPQTLQSPFPPDHLTQELWNDICTNRGGDFSLPYYYLSLTTQIVNIAEKHLVGDLGGTLNQKTDATDTEGKDQDGSTLLQKYNSGDTDTIEKLNKLILERGVNYNLNIDLASHPNYDPNSDEWLANSRSVVQTGGKIHIDESASIDAVLNRNAFMLTSDTQLIVNGGTAKASLNNRGLYGVGTGGGVSLVQHAENAAKSISIAKRTLDSIPDRAEDGVIFQRWMDQFRLQLNRIADSTDCMRKSYEDFEKEKEAVSDALKDLADKKLKNSLIPDFLSQSDRRKEALRKKIDDYRANLDNKNINDFRNEINNNSARIFREQCFLLAFAAKFAGHKKYDLDTFGKTPVHKRLAYHSLGDFQDTISNTDQYNASVQVDGNPFGFINRLTQSPNYEAFVNIPHQQLSALQPKIRLFKVVQDDDPLADSDAAGLEKEVELKFESSFSQIELEDIFKDKHSRGAGVGLKSFDFTYDGSNPFSAKKSIKAKLVLFANSMSELFYEREGEAIYSSFDSDNKIQLSTESVQYRYIDLALKTSTNSSQNDINRAWAQMLEDNGQLAKLNFRLKAVVGWAMPAGKLPGESSGRFQTSKLRDAIKESTVTLNLTPTIHNFEFDQSGRVTFEINYLAYVEDFFDERAFNAFADYQGKASINRELRRLQIKNFRQRCSSHKNITEANEQYAAQVTKDIGQSLSSLVSGLMRDNRIYYLDLPYSKVQKFIASGPYEKFENYIDKPIGDVIKDGTNNNLTTLNNIQNALDGAVSAELKEKGSTSSGDFDIGTALMVDGPNGNQLSYFYLSDLVDVVLKNIQIELDTLEEFYEKNDNVIEYTGSEVDKIPIKDWEKRLTDIKKHKENFRRARVLLGPVELVHHKKEDGTFEKVNFGDVPISLKYFIEWISCKVLSKDEIFFPLSSFLNQLMNNLVTNFLNSNDCFAYDIKQKIRVNQAVLSAQASGKLDPVTSFILQQPRGKDGPLRLDLDSSVAKENRPIIRSNYGGTSYTPLFSEINYLSYFAGRVASSNAVANREKDERAGLFHYKLGEDRGLVKEIKLRKTQTKGLAEARFEQDGYDGLQQLRVVYDLDISSYANVNTYPGTYIYVPPAGFDPAWANYGFKSIDLTSLGIGGYYMIIRSSHRFAAGEATTNIFAKWVNSLETDYPNRDAGSKKNSEPDDNCGTAIERLDWHGLSGDEVNGET